MSDLSSQLASLRIERATDGSARPNPWPKRAFVLVLLGLAAFLALQAWPRVQRRLDAVEVATTRIGSVTQADSLVSVTATGYVVALRIASIGAEAQTRIVEANVREGASVTAGQVLYRFATTEAEAAISAAESQIAAARARAQVARAQTALTRAQIERENAVASRGIGQASVAADLGYRLATEEAQVTAAEAEVRAAAAQAATQRAALERYEVVAPFDGVVLNTPPEVGAVLDPTRPLVELMDPASLVVEADVPEGRVAGVSLGTACEVVFDAWPDRRFSGEVVGFGPTLDRARATAPVRIRVSEAGPIVPEMSARVRFLREALPASEAASPPKTVVSQSAVASIDGQQFVFTLEGDSVRRLPVRLGDPLGAGFEVLEGPAPGTRVVDSPPAGLQEGQLVRERQP